MSAILNPGAGKFRFSAPEAAPALRPFVAHYWIVAWDLRGQAPYEQRVLPHPAVNITFKPGRCRIAGVPRGRFSEVLEGAGRVFGVRFRPGGFRPFLGAPVSTLTDRFVALEAVFGAAGGRLAEAVVAAADWAVDRSSPPFAQLDAALRALEGVGFPVDPASLQLYVRAAEDVAREEVGLVPRGDTAAAVAFVVLGTVLYEPVLLALRRLAQQHASATTLD